MCDDGLGDADLSDSVLTRRTYIDEDDWLEYEYLETRAGSKPGLPRRVDLKMLTRTLTWYSRPYATGDNRKFLFRSSNGLAKMLIHGGYE